MGRHRAPTTTGRTIARAITVTAVASAPVAAAVPAMASSSWDEVKGAIEQCESGGRNVPTAVPGPFTASGFWQITNPTWRDHGGGEFAPRALLATHAEQEIVAERLFDARGTQPWDASKACWQNKLGRHASDQEAPKPAAQPPRHAAPAAPGGTYVVQPGDTLSKIAAAHHTTWQKLFAANRDVVAHQDRIFPGEHLRT